MNTRFSQAAVFFLLSSLFLSQCSRATSCRNASGSGTETCTAADHCGSTSQVQGRGHRHSGGNCSEPNGVGAGGPGPFFAMSNGGGGPAVGSSLTAYQYDESRIAAVGRSGRYPRGSNGSSGSTRSNRSSASTHSGHSGSGGARVQVDGPSTTVAANGTGQAACTHDLSATSQGVFACRTQCF